MNAFRCSWFNWRGSLGRDFWQKVDYGVNAPDHIEALHDVANMAQGGVQVGDA